VSEKCLKWEWVRFFSHFGLVTNLKKWHLCIFFIATMLGKSSSTYSVLKLMLQNYHLSIQQSLNLYTTVSWAKIYQSVYSGIVFNIFVYPKSPTKPVKSLMIINSYYFYWWFINASYSVHIHPVPRLYIQGQINEFTPRGWPGEGGGGWGSRFLTLVHHVLIAQLNAAQIGEQKF